MREQIRLIANTKDNTDLLSASVRIATLSKKGYSIVESYISEDQQYFVLEEQNG
jgi:hypothetical protein